MIKGVTYSIQKERAMEIDIRRMCRESGDANGNNPILYSSQIRMDLQILPNTIEEAYRDWRALRKDDDPKQEQLKNHLRALLRHFLNTEVLSICSDAQALLQYAPVDSIEWIRIFCAWLKLVQTKEEAHLLYRKIVYEGDNCAKEYRVQALKKIAEFYVVEE